MKKDLLMLAFAALLLFLVVSGMEIQSVEEYYLMHAEDITEDSETVTISIDCSSVFDHWEQLAPALKDESYLPADGKILAPTEYVLRADDTAFTLLQRATQRNRIQMEYQGADNSAYHSAYIQGIQYLYEFSCGPLSGWMYKVNGEFPKEGCSRYVLKDKDQVEFIYSCDLGRDIGGEFSEGNLNE